MLAKKSLAAAFILLGSIVMWGVQVPEAKVPPGAPADSATPEVISNFGRLPLAFIENQGQVDSPAQFYTVGQRIQVGFSPREITLAFPSPVAGAGNQESMPPSDRALRPAAASQVPPQVVRWQPVNLSQSVKLTGGDLLPGKFNHYQGSDPNRWRGGLPTYGAVV
jgi:hypothetical protein